MMMDFMKTGWFSWFGQKQEGAGKQLLRRLFCAVAGKGGHCDGDDDDDDDEDDDDGDDEDDGI